MLLNLISCFMFAFISSLCLLRAITDGFGLVVGDWTALIGFYLLAMLFSGLAQIVVKQN